MRRAVFTTPKALSALARLVVSAPIGAANPCTVNKDRSTLEIVPVLESSANFCMGKSDDAFGSKSSAHQYVAADRRICRRQRVARRVLETARVTIEILANLPVS